MGDAQQSLPRAAFLRRIMKAFIGYWIAVLRLTKAQAFALFYRFVRYTVGNKEGDENDD